MNQHRFVAFVATAFLLYVLASAGAARVTFTQGAAFLVAVAFLCALVPLWLSRSESSEGPSLVALLAAVLSFLLGGYLVLEVHALLGEIACALALPALGALTLRLALYVPDVPPRLLRHVRSEALVRVFALLTALLGVASALPPLVVGGRALIAPHYYARAPLSFALSALVLSALARSFRRRLGSDARALSANLWPALGTCAGLVLVGCSFVVRLAFGPSLGVEHALLAAGAGVFAVGHLWLVSKERARVASAWARELFAIVVAFAFVLCLWLLTPLPEDPFSRAVAFAALLLAFGLTRRALSKVSRGLLAPHGGRLLSAVDEVFDGVASAESFDALAARVLRPLRRASGSPEAAPLLISFHPQREVRLDAAGQPRAQARALTRVIEHKLRELRGEAIVRDDLAARLLRRPELRDLVVALDELDALCVVPLLHEGDLDGVLVLSRGARKDPLTLEELMALDRLARWVAPMAAVFLQKERESERSNDALARVKELSLRMQELEDELAQLRAHANLIKAARGAPRDDAPIIAYSGAMRELVERIEAAAAHDVSVLFLSESGVPLASLARLVHVKSGRHEAPFVIGDCASFSHDRALSALFGDGTEPGLLELAGEGTLALLDIAALPLEAQRALSDALSEKRARDVAGGPAYPVRARIVASARGPLTELVAVSAVGPELARWLEPVSLRVPPLRERREDLESLVLVALDRAARVLGRDVPGLDRDALAALAEYDWPGNLAELTSVIERAVSSCKGARVSLSDLPPLTAGSATAGSFVDQERDILRRALERAGGNKTRAARALGLKRTTLIDKLRRLGLETSPQRTEH